MEGGERTTVSRKSQRREIGCETHVSIPSGCPNSSHLHLRKSFISALTRPCLIICFIYLFFGHAMFDRPVVNSPLLYNVHHTYITFCLFSLTSLQLHVGDGVDIVSSRPNTERSCVSDSANHRLDKWKTTLLVSAYFTCLHGTH